MSGKRIRKFVAVDCWPLRIPSRFLPPHVPGRPRNPDLMLRDFTSDADVFRQQSIVVTCLYGRHLGSGPPIMATVWGARIFVHDSLAHDKVPAGVNQSWGDEPRNDLGTFEMCHVEVDTRVVGLPDPQRRGPMLDWLHARLTDLAEARGWPVEAFDRAYRLCRQDDLRFVVDGKPKFNPGRTRRARPSLEIDGNGDGWLTIAVENKAGEPVCRLGPWDTPTAGGTRNYVLSSLRWTSATELSFNPWPESAAWPGAPDPVRGIAISVE